MLSYPRLLRRRREKHFIHDLWKDAIIHALREGGGDIALYTYARDVPVQTDSKVLSQRQRGLCLFNGVHMPGTCPWKLHQTNIFRLHKDSVVFVLIGESAEMVTIYSSIIKSNITS